jgi:hypothetical protein
MKQWLAYFCILLFSFQVMPVKEIGIAVFTGQMTEEERLFASDVSEDGHSKLKKQSDPYHYSDHAQACARIQLLTQQVHTAIEAACMSQDYTADILTPPPDYLQGS